MTIASRYTVEEFGNDVRKMLDSGGTDIAAILRLGHLLQRFGAENSRDYFWSIGEPATISSGLPGQKLYALRMEPSACCSPNTRRIRRPLSTATRAGSS